MSVTFEWDATKALENIRKHGVTFEEASSAFFDPLSLTVSDSEHSDVEERFVLIGLSNTRKVLVVVHLDFGDKLRIISARVASRRERREYEGT